MMNQTTPPMLSRGDFNNSRRHKIRRILEEEAFMQSHQHRFKMLTNREKEILRLLANDFNNPQIATMLFISRKTVEQHRKHINKKLEMNTPIQLLKYALAFDLI